MIHWLKTVIHLCVSHPSRAEPTRGHNPIAGAGIFVRKLIVVSSIDGPLPPHDGPLQGQLLKGCAAIAHADFALRSGLLLVSVPLEEGVGWREANWRRFCRIWEILRFHDCPFLIGGDWSSGSSGVGLSRCDWWQGVRFGGEGHLQVQRLWLGQWRLSTSSVRRPSHTSNSCACSHFTSNSHSQEGSPTPASGSHWLCKEAQPSHHRFLRL